MNYCMQFRQSLQPAILLRRYKRFLADVELPDGTSTTVHCPNSGSMLGCIAPGLPVMISESGNPKRKYAHTLEMIKVGAVWVGINTSLTNKLVKEAIEARKISEIGRVESIRAEVVVSKKSRLDFLLEKKGKPLYMEVKNCTLAEKGVAMFPDAVTARGARHLEELQRLREHGHDAAVLFCVQRMDADFFAPAYHIDPLYAARLQESAQKGVKILAYQADVRPEKIEIVRRLPVLA